jgi:hypothetical protein
MIVQNDADDTSASRADNASNAYTPMIVSRHDPIFDVAQRFV